MIVKLDEANKLNETLKNQISSQVDKIKSKEEQLSEFKVEVEKLFSVKSIDEPNSKDIYIYIPPFKKNNEEELKANIVKIDKGKKIYVDTVISKPMSKSSPRLQENMNLSSLVIIIMLLVILGQIVLS